MLTFIEAVHREAISEAVNLVCDVYSIKNSCYATIGQKEF
jgi:hypothetical protein